MLLCIGTSARNFRLHCNQIPKRKPASNLLLWLPQSALLRSFEYIHLLPYLLSNWITLLWIYPVRDNSLLFFQINCLYAFTNALPGVWNAWTSQVQSKFLSILEDSAHMFPSRWILPGVPKSLILRFFLIPKYSFQLYYVI